jgi:hypothetical protein
MGFFTINILINGETDRQAEERYIILVTFSGES